MAAVVRRAPPPEKCRRRSVDDDGDREAVVALRADGLDGGGLQARLGGRGFEETPDATDVLVFAGGVGDDAGADDVVGDDERAGPGDLEGPLEVVGVSGFVGVDEDEVERGPAFVGELGE
jgi:hypothetical protein